MNPVRFEWQTRCEFNAYCKHSLRNELIDALRERKSRKRREVNFSDLTPHEEKQLYTVDRYFVNEEEEAFCVGGLKITAKLLADALHSLPDEKRQAILLYYFFSMKEGNPIRLYTISEISKIFSKLDMSVCKSYADFTGKLSSDNDIQLMVYSVRN